MGKRWFRCPICNTKVSTGNTKRIYPRGHVKHMWCWRCRKKTPHVLMRSS